MGASDLFRILADEGVTLKTTHQGGLTAHGNPEAIASHREAIRKNKAELLAILTSENQAASLIEANTLAAEVGKLNGIDPATVAKAIEQIGLFTDAELAEFIKDAKAELAARNKQNAGTEAKP